MKISRGRADMCAGRPLDEFYKFERECDEVTDEELLEFLMGREGQPFVDR